MNSNSKEIKGNTVMIIENNQDIKAADFTTIEKHYSCSIPCDIRSFLEKYNGEIVSPEDGLEITYVTDQGKSITDSFPTIRHTKNIIKQLQFIDYIEEFLEDSNWSENDVEADKLLPLMAINGGSVNLYIAICGTHQDKLFVVDNGDYGVSKVSLTFAELVKQIDSK